MKMELSLEIPPALISRLRFLTDFDFALAQIILANEQYANSYRNRGSRLLIMDNGANELDKPLLVSDILRAAELVDPDVVIAPDVPGDALATLSKFQEFIKCNLQFGVMGVVQGHTIDECLLCANEYLKYDLVWCLGVPCDVLCQKTDPLVKMSACRKELVAVLTKLGMSLHLLGVSLPEELSAYKNNKRVISVDTGTPLLYALKGTRFGTGVSYDKVCLLDLNAREITDEQYNTLLHNVSYLRACMEGVRVNVASCN
jgi:hypothetical protein